MQEISQNGNDSIFTGRMQLTLLEMVYLIHNYITQQYRSAIRLKRLVTK